MLRAIGVLEKGLKGKLIPALNVSTPRRIGDSMACASS